MVPYVLTIIKPAAVPGLAIGAIVALARGYIQYNKLHSALTRNITPPQVQWETRL